MGDYLGFVASAYGFSALALASLGLWIFIDARAARRALKALEGAGARRGDASRGNVSREGPAT